MSDSEDNWRVLTPGCNIGFEMDPYLEVEKELAAGYRFNILCIGDTGCGKTTLIESLFRVSRDPQSVTQFRDEVSLERSSWDLREQEVTVKLDVVETSAYASYGDQLNKETSIQPIVNFLDEQHYQYLTEDLKLKRDFSNFQDTRVHLCLYFILPTGRRLRTLDVACMKAIHDKVNIVPVIAMSDTIMKADMVKFKQRIASDLEQNGIRIFKFPEDKHEANTALNAAVPFSVVAATEEMKVGNKTVRGRQYPWGIVQIENEQHCDFVKLREAVVRVNMHRLILNTRRHIYSQYRKLKLTEMGYDDGDRTLLWGYKTKPSAHQTHVATQENEMKKAFIARVKEKEADLKEEEKQMHQAAEGDMQQLEMEKNQTQSERMKLEQEMREFQQRKQLVDTYIAGLRNDSTLKKKR